jgi:hypothetical protein
MDEMKKDMGHPDSYNCNSCSMMGRNMCGMCGGRRFWAIRWLLGVLIIVVVFAIGVKVGEFKAFFDTGFGSYDYPTMQMHRIMMMRGNEMNEMYGTMPTTQVMMVAPSASATPVK